MIGKRQMVRVLRERNRQRMGLGLLLVYILIVLVWIFRYQPNLISVYRFHENGWQKFNYSIFNVFRAKPPKCGYDSCPKLNPEMLNVHIVAHTHDDVGWLKTVDQYYYGSQIKHQRACVQYILDSVIQSLLQDPNKRFIYVESAFFFKWWDHQTDSLKEQVKQLVNEGRLEFIGGAWSMNDEATTHYQSTIDQFTWGLRKLNDTFGECGRPKVGWQIDPFGHSREFASLLAQMRFDGLFLGRADYQYKEKLWSERNAEMIWHVSDSLGEKGDLFTGVLFNVYQPPPGFCFDDLCSDDQIIDDKSSPEYNLDEKLEQFDKYIHKQANTTRTNNIILTMGGDFTYMNAHAYYSNLDRLIWHVNERQKNGSKVNLFYSTPSCYLKSLHDANKFWPTKNDDFFPYASDPHSYWTGYFTSRPTIKYYERVGNCFLQVCKQLTVLSPKRNFNFDENLTVLREAMGVMQHHDAVTGTEKQHVANDYARLLHNGIDKCHQNINEALNQLTIEATDFKMNPENALYNNFRFDFAICPDLNISSCQISESNEKFMITLYNPLSHAVSHYIRIPVRHGVYEIKDYSESIIESQLIWIPHGVQAIPYRHSDAHFELVFKANKVPPVGYKSYFITGRLEEFDLDHHTKHDEFHHSFTIGNKFLNLTFDANGLLESVSRDNIQMSVRQNFYFYKGCSDNNNGSEHRSSGAYIFRPNGTEAHILSARAIVRVTRGELVEEVHQTFNEWISQVIRVYKNEEFAEFEWLVGEIPIEDGVGREIITRFDTDIKSKGVFFTDSNGREMLKRQRDRRSTWDLKLSEKVSGNYYPVTSQIAIEDEQKKMAILTDRAQGGSSLTDGSIELMVHRRLLHDDDFGVVEALNETAFGKGLIVRGKSYFVFGSKIKTNVLVEATERFIQIHKQLPPLPFFSDASQFTYEQWRSSFMNIYSGLALSLPIDVHLLTFEPWKTGSILIRFEHIMEKNDDKEFSKDITFNLTDVFRSFRIVDIREATLAGNQWLNEAKTFEFTAEGEKKRRSTNEVNEDETKNVDKFVITLKPMEIRTFILQVDFNIHV